MIQEEIRKQMAESRARIEEVSKLLETEEDSRRRLAYVHELMDCADRISALDSLNKRLIKMTLAERIKSLIDSFNNK